MIDVQWFYYFSEENYLQQAFGLLSLQELNQLGFFFFSFFWVSLFFLTWSKRGLPSYK